MNLSITKNLLTGPFLRKDIFISSDPHIEIINKNRIYVDHDLRYRFHWSNYCGMIPLVSTVTGSIRALIGLIHTIVHLAKSIFDKKRRKDHLLEAALGAYSVIRGCVEAVPLLGNLAIIEFDVIRINSKKTKSVYIGPSSEYRA